MCAQLGTIILAIKWQEKRKEKREKWLKQPRHILRLSLSIR